MAFPMISVSMWGALLWLGWILREGVVQQNVSGYPNQAQTTTLVMIPAIMTAFNMLISLISKKIHTGILATSTVIQLFACLYIFTLFSGGI